MCALTGTAKLTMPLQILSLANWDVCSDRNLLLYHIDCDASLANWDVCSDRNLFAFYFLMFSSLANWDVCSDRNRSNGQATGGREFS